MQHEKSNGSDSHTKEKENMPISGDKKQQGKKNKTGNEQDKDKSSMKGNTGNAGNDTGKKNPGKNSL